MRAVIVAASFSLVFCATTLKPTEAPAAAETQAETTGVGAGADEMAGMGGDDPLAELAALGDAFAEFTPEGGGSIRAKRRRDPELMKRLKDPRNIEAKIESVKTGKFPLVALRLKVMKPAKEGPGKDTQRGDTVVIVPKYQSKKGAISWSDSASVRNAGAYYLRGGDKVVVRLGAQKGKLWEAEYIERK